MKIILVNVAFGNNSFGALYHLPIGLLNVAQTFSDCGIESSILDIPWEEYEISKKQNYSAVDRIIKEIQKNKADYLGFYTRCDILPSVISLARQIKHALPDKLIILGGPGATFVDTEILHYFPEIDLVLRGEGETVIQNLIDSGGLNNDLYAACGITYRGENGIVRNESQALIKDLNCLPVPDYRYIPQYQGCGTLVSIEAGRGCPYNCTFCSTSVFWDRNYRTKQPKRIVEEMANAVRFFHTTRINLIHDNLIVSKKFAVELTQEIRNRLPDVKWRCSGRVDLLDEDIIINLLSSGCENIFLGIETGSQRLQRVIKKNLNLEIAEKNIRLCNKHGLRCWVSFIIGFPEEKEEDMEQTLGLALKFRQYSCISLAQVHWLSPDPGSDLHSSHRDKLQFTNSLSDHAASVRGLCEVEKELVVNYPTVFSSFYDLSTNQVNQRYKKFLRCFKVFLDFYPKTLFMLNRFYGIKMLYILSAIKSKCNCPDECTNFQIMQKNCGYIQSIQDLYDVLGIKVSAILSDIAAFERACAGLFILQRAKDNGYSRQYTYIDETVRVVRMRYEWVNLAEYESISQIPEKDEDQYAIIIKKTVRDTIETISINKVIYEVTHLLDGHHSITQISQITGYEDDIIRQVISMLASSELATVKI